MVKGPFKRWTHLHIFHSINDQKQTEVVDEIIFEIPYGRVGKLLEGYAYTQLQKLFDHRKAATIKTLVDNTSLVHRQSGSGIVHQTIR